MLFKLSTNMDQYVYLIQLREFVMSQQPVYKIGKTHCDPNTRLKGYPKMSRVLLFLRVEDCDVLERCIIRQFSQRYQQCKQYGTEYFRGDLTSMMTDMCVMVGQQYTKVANCFTCHEGIYAGESVPVVMCCGVYHPTCCQLMTCVTCGSVAQKEKVYLCNVPPCKPYAELVTTIEEAQVCLFYVSSAFPANMQWGVELGQALALKKVVYVIQESLNENRYLQMLVEDARAHNTALVSMPNEKFRFAALLQHFLPFVQPSMWSLQDNLLCQQFTKYKFKSATFDDDMVITIASLKHPDFWRMASLNDQ